MNTEWPKKIEAKRVTLNRPHLQEVTQDVKDLILENNQIDFELYKFCLDLLNQHKLISSRNFQFNNDNYGYVMKYSERFQLFDLCASKSRFFSTNIEFFKN